MITKELQNKLVTRCQNPRTVVNKYTHEPVVVSCGSCPSCILRRSGIQTNLLTSYSAQFRYVYFVTLTYAPCFLPTLEVSVVETCTDDIADVSVVPDINDLDVRDFNTYLFGFRSVPRSASVKLKNSTVERTFKDPDVMFSYPMTPKELLSILNKVKHNVPNRIPYVCNRDLDLFLKRLRSYYPNEKLRYYAVSEYGPTSYRPHWHLLLFSNSERFSQTVLENVSKAWSYGRCDASLSRGFAAPYVASYVNSFVSLPDFYVQMPKVVRPKSFHSVGFTESNLFPRKVRITEIDEVADKCLNGVRVERDGYFRTVKPSWSYLLRLFPRFSDAIRQSPSNVYQLLSAAFTAPERVIRSGCADLSCDPFNESSKQSILSFCKQYLNYVDNYGKRNDERNVLSPKENLPHSDILILSECRLYDGVDLETVHRTTRLYRFFLGIMKFIRTYLSNGEFLWSGSSFRGYACGRERALRVLSEKIVEFWSRYDYNRLVDFYQTLEDSDDKDLLDFEIRNYSFRYDKSVLDDEVLYKSFPLVRRLAAVSLMKCRDKVKHKKVNDSFGIFSYQD
uniref:Replication initiator protein n=1 Tax=Dulem virus 257 TaxID=3145734 RepID=A0AAU8B555_9VIRU